MIAVTLAGFARGEAGFEPDGGDRCTVYTSGHAGSAPKGSDLICASVSILFHAVLRSLSARNIEFIASKEDGILGFSLEWKKLREIDRMFAAAAIEVMIHGLETLRVSSPQYISIEFED